MNYLVFLILQNTLNQLERDCDNIGAKVNLAIAEDNTSRSHNMWAWTKGLGYLFAGQFCHLFHFVMMNFCFAILFYFRYTIPYRAPAQCFSLIILGQIHQGHFSEKCL